MRYLWKVLFLSVVILSSLSYSKGVLAGTSIVNVASIKYTSGGQAVVAMSNEVVDIVDQLIDLKVVCQDVDYVKVQSGELQRVLTFQIDNLGNADDIFGLETEENSTSTFSVSNQQIYRDMDTNGIYDPNIDKLVKDINMSVDANATLFFVSDMPTNVKTLVAKSAKLEKSTMKKAPNATTRPISINGIKATSKIGGSGTVGKHHQLADYTAVDGVKGGVDKDCCVYEMSLLALRLKKSVTLSSSKLYSGSTMHYKIEATVAGEGLIKNVIIKDTIPKGTSYIANSIKLDGKPIADSSSMAQNEVVVNIGDVVQSSTHKPLYVLEFDVLVE